MFLWQRNQMSGSWCDMRARTAIIKRIIIIPYRFKNSVYPHSSINARDKSDVRLPYSW